MIHHNQISVRLSRCEACHCTQTADDVQRFVMVARKDDDESSDSMEGILMLVENWSAE